LEEGGDFGHGRHSHWSGGGSGRRRWRGGAGRWKR
jgi:hypothetical protein